MAIEFEHYYVKVPEKYLDAMYDLLYENMSKIAPTGNSYEKDKAIWINNAVHSFNQVILMINSGKLIGYFRYRLLDKTFYMDDIQFHPDYFGSGLFEKLYEFLISILPSDTLYVKAHASKMNIKSQRVLEHLGLEIEGENKTKLSFSFCGKYENLKLRYTK